MWIPKNPPGGLPVKILTGVASLALVHVLFIGAHTILDDTSPLDIAYPLDRTVEAFELQWAMLWGHEAVVESRLHAAQERIREAEELAEHVRADALTQQDITDTVRMLLNDAQVQIDLAVHRFQQGAGDHSDEVSGFASAIFVQSALEDMMLRLRNVLPVFEGSTLLSGMAENFLATTQSYADISDALVAEYTVSDDVRLTILEEVRREIFGTVSEQLVVPEQPQLCADSGTECATTADCCDEQGLTCMPFQSSNGFTRRCQRTAHSICTTECENVSGELQWGEPRRCIPGYIEEGMSPCSSMVQRVCGTESEPVRCWER